MERCCHSIYRVGKTRGGSLAYVETELLLFLVNYGSEVAP